MVTFFRSLSHDSQLPFDNKQDYRCKSTIDQPLSYSSFYAACSHEKWSDVYNTLSAGEIDPSLCRGGCFDFTALHLIVRWAEDDLAKVAIQKSRDVNAANKIGVTVLLEAVKNGDAYRCKLLLEKGADPDIESDGGTSPLGLAITENKTELVKLLVNTGAEVSFYQEEKVSVVAFAVASDDIDLMKGIVDSNKFRQEVNIKDKENRYPLDNARSKWVIRSLIAAGAREWTIGSGKDYIINEELKLRSYYSNGNKSDNEMTDIKDTLTTLIAEVNKLSETVRSDNRDLKQHFDEKITSIVTGLRWQQDFDNENSKL